MKRLLAVLFFSLWSLSGQADGPFLSGLGGGGCTANCTFTGTTTTSGITDSGGITTTTLQPSTGVVINPAATASQGALCIIGEHSTNATVNTNREAHCQVNLTSGTQPFAIFGSSGTVISGQRNIAAHILSYATDTNLTLSGSNYLMTSNSVALIQNWNRCDTGTYNTCAQRWDNRLVGDSETGSDVGSDMEWVPYADDGASTPAGVPTQSDSFMAGSALRLKRKDGSLNVAGQIISHAVCATGFTRDAPNHCHRDGSATLVSWTDHTACTSWTTGMSLPATAKTVDLAIHWKALSNAGTGARTNQVNFFNDSSCTSATHTGAHSLFNVYEQILTSAGTVLGEHTDHVKVPLVSTDTFYATETNAGGNGNASIVDFLVEGYGD